MDKGLKNPRNPKKPPLAEIVRLGSRLRYAIGPRWAGSDGAVRASHFCGSLKRSAQRPR